MERLVMNADAAKHVQAYIEYEQIVGNADGGKMMSEAEFEAYKQQVKEARKNRLYVHWRNTGTGQDCKTIGPASQCFCGHRYKQHNHDNVKTRQINCQEPKCKCKMFTYIPIFGSQDLKCLCKHSTKDHLPNGSRLCQAQPNCRNKCQGFTSVHSCSCGQAYDLHDTVFESREEREATGRPVDPKWMQEQNMVAGMGGLTQGYSDLVDAEERNVMMDPKQVMHNLSDNKMIKGQMAIGGNQALAIGGGQNSSAYALFTQPHRFGKQQLAIGMQKLKI